MVTYDKSTEALLELHGHLIHPTLKRSYRTIFEECHNNNWRYFKVRLPLVKLDRGDVPTRSAKAPSHTKQAWDVYFEYLDTLTPVSAIFAR